MAKSKKPKKEVNLTPQYLLSKEELAEKAKKKKKKKHEPARQQPEWLFPPDELNPVLNPTTKSEAVKAKEKAEHDASINYLQHRAVGAPLLQPPPAMLLALVGAFLTTYGFDSASRLFTSQLNARKRLDDWDIEIGKKLPKGLPALTIVYKEWLKAFGVARIAEAGEDIDEAESESESEDDRLSRKKKNQAKSLIKTAKDEGDDTSSSGSESNDEDDSESDSDNDSDADEKNDLSDVAMEDAPVVRITKKTTTVTTKDESDSSDSGSDSDTESTSPANANAASSPTSSSSDSDSSNSDSSAASTSSASSSDAESVADDTLAAKTVTESTKRKRPEPSSSDTVARAAKKRHHEPIVNGHSSSSNKNDTVVVASTVTTTTTTPSDLPDFSSSAKPMKMNEQRFQRISSTQSIDPRLSSNAYQSHDYGERAHRDLIVTKGKGFTKEKNKKKRGSYRGGAINVHGGGGVRFD